MQKQKLENQESIQKQRKNKKVVVITLFIVASFLLATMFLIKKEHKAPITKESTRIGVTGGIPYIIGKRLEGVYGKENIQCNELEVYDFQDC